MPSDEKKKKYTFEKDTKTANVNAPDIDTYQADYSHEEDMEKVKQLETCGLGPDEEGICAPEEKKPEHVYVSEEQKKKKQAR